MRPHVHGRGRLAGPMVVLALAATLLMASPATPASADGGPATAARPSPGCGVSTAPPVTDLDLTLDVGGSPRTYRLTVPPAHDGTTPLPLVVDIHGLAEGAVIHSAMSQYSPLAVQEGFVVVYPQGLGTPARWDLSLPASANPDLAYFDALLDELGRTLCLDEARTYATGLSFGAMMTSFLACHRADRFAAFAPVAGVRPFTDCSEVGRPRPLLAFHGTEDPIVYFNGGFGAIPPTVPPPPADLRGAGTPATVAAWAAGNGCEPDPPDTPTSEHVLRRTYACPDGADVTFVMVVGGGHSWPGSQFSASIASIVGPTTFEIDATRASWDFFRLHALPCSGDDCQPTPSTTSTTAPASTSTTRRVAGGVATAVAVTPRFTG